MTRMSIHKDRQEVTVTRLKNQEMLRPHQDRTGFYQLWKYAQFTENKEIVELRIRKENKDEATNRH